MILLYVRIKRLLNFVLKLVLVPTVVSRPDTIKSRYCCDICVDLYSSVSMSMSSSSSSSLVQKKEILTVHKILVKQCLYYSIYIL